jgi:hypothetical protein
MSNRTNGGALTSTRHSLIGSIRTGGVADSSALFSTKGTGGRPNNVVLSLDPNLPSNLDQSGRWWAWLLLCLGLLGFFGAAFALAGVAVPVPHLSLNNDEGSHAQFTLAGWAFHAFATICFLGSAVACMIKKSPWRPRQFCLVSTRHQDAVAVTSPRTGERTFHAHRLVLFACCLCCSDSSLLPAVAGGIRDRHRIALDASGSH